MTDSIDLDNPPPEEVGNRAFGIIIAILAAVGVFIVAGIIVILIYLNANKAAVPSAGQTQTVVAAGASKTAGVLTATALAPLPLTPTPTHPTATPRPATDTPLPVSDTPVVNQAFSTDTPTVTITGTLPTSTITLTGTKPTGTPTALPKTGIGDSAGGLPGLAVLAIALVVVAFLARRLRLSRA